MFRHLLILAIVLALVACERTPSELILVRPSSPIDEQILESLVEIFDNEASVSLRLGDEALSGADAIAAVAEGRADLALITNDQPYRDDVATVMPLYPTVFHVIVPDTHQEDNLAEILHDATVYAGEEGSASRRVFERLTAHIDLAGKPFRFETDRTANADVATVFAPVSPDRLAEFPNVRLWSFDAPDRIGRGGIIDAIVLMNPHFRPFIIPGGTYGDAAAGPVVTVAVDKILITRTDLAASLVYDLIDNVLRLRPALGTIHPGLFQELSESFDVSRSQFLVHAGAQDYLQRSEPSYIERYSGVAEVLVTLMIGAISASVAGLRILARRRKNRIDRFYSAVLRIRERVSPAMGESARDEAVAELRQLQDEAFALLVDEKLAADESFGIFMSLSGDVMDQLRGQHG